MLRAYCDASRKNGRVSISAILLTSNLYVDYEVRILPDVITTSHGELRAVMLVFEMISRNYDTPQDVCIYSDSASIVQQFNTTLTTGKIPKNRVYYEDWVRLAEMCEKSKVTVRHIKSHQNVRSCHYACDCAARAILSDDNIKLLT